MHVHTHEWTHAKRPSTLHPSFHARDIYVLRAHGPRCDALLMQHWQFPRVPACLYRRALYYSSTVEHRNQNRVCLVKILEYIGFCTYDGS